MARYIDADDLKAVINANDWSNPVVPDVVGIIIDRTPTADVVPKSEYDAVVSALDNSTKEFLKLHDDYQEAKREIDKWMGRCREWHEVAEEKSKLVREIFAEIEKYKRSPMPECKPVYVINDSGFAELKKKYAGEKS